MRVGLISDTHGLLRPEAVKFLRGSDLILHAGDIGRESVLDALAELAPVTAVRGNNDHGNWASALPDVARLCLSAIRVWVIHDVAELEIEPGLEPPHVVVCGHSHRPRIEHRGGVLFVNPGSAGPRRFSLPISAGQLLVLGTDVQPELVTLGTDPSG
jgi:putative phosphoesterase